MKKTIGLATARMNSRSLVSEKLPFIILNGGSVLGFTGVVGAMTGLDYPPEVDIAFLVIPIILLTIGLLFHSKLDLIGLIQTALEWTKSNHIFFVIFALIASINIYAAGKDSGIGLSPDSINYLLTSEQFLEYKFNSFSAMWPPLYPVVVAIISWLFNVHWMTGALVVSSLLYFIFSLLIGILLSQVIKSRLFIISGAYLLTFSALSSSIYVMAWSESVYLPLVMASILCFAQWSQTRKRFHLVLVGGFAGIAACARYGGLVVFGTFFMFLLVLLFMKKCKFSSVVIFTIVSMSPFLILMARNYLVMGTFMGGRYPSAQEFNEVILIIVNSLRGMFVPIDIGFIIVVCLMCCMIIFQFVGPQKYRYQSHTLQIMLLLVVTQLCFLLFSAVQIALEEISFRYLSVVYLCIGILVIQTISVVHKIVNGGKTRHFQQWICLILLIPLFTQSGFQTHMSALKVGIGLHAPIYRDSETINFLIESNNPSVTYYSNEIWAIQAYLGSQIQMAKLPEYIPFRSDTVINTVDELKGRWPGEAEGAYLVWFTGHESTEFFTEEEYLSIADCSLSKELADSRTYWCVPLKMEE